MKRYFILLLALLCLLAGCQEAPGPETTVPETTVPETTVPGPTLPQRPLVDLEPTVGFAWEVRDGIAYLADNGEVTQGDIVIPARVRLTQTDAGWKEDPEGGTEYPVTVEGDAFYLCSQLTTVTFNTGVSIENDRMKGDAYGMFALCSSLTGVYNIPDSVTSMSSTFASCKALVEIDYFPYCLTDLSGCFRNCASLESVPELPDSITHMSGCFNGCSSLVEVPNIPASAVDLLNCFRDCTALVSVPDFPGTVAAVSGCFSGCSSLVQAPSLPYGITNLSNCFQGCSSLMTVPALPDSVVDMTECFSGCSVLQNLENIPASVVILSKCFLDCISLESIPDLPKTASSLSYAFANCHSMRGTVTIPESSIANDRTRSVFYACYAIDHIIFDTCELGVDTSDYVLHSVEMSYLYEHSSQGLCPHCGYTDREAPQPASPYIMDNIPEYYATWFVDFIENSVPEFLKKKCTEYTFTDNIRKHTDNKNARYWDGFTSNNKICIELLSSVSSMKYIIYHELGHCYDTEGPFYHDLIFDGGLVISGYGVFRDGIYSQSPEWTVLHETEGAAAAQWYGSIYHTYTDEVKRMETFAISVGKYFTDPNALKARCPGMYEYVDNLFRDLIAAEEAAKSAQAPAA